MKKALAILLVYSILMTLLVISPFTANANEKKIVETGDTVASGTTGDCTWKIEGTKLTISGNGKMGVGINDRGYGEPAMEHIIVGSIMYQPWCCNGNDYSNIITEVVIENGITSIADCAFYTLNNLTRITIPESVEIIGKGAFLECKKLKSVTLCDSVTHIGDGAFFECKGLSSVIIGNSVESIGNSAFDGCTGLTSVTLSQFALDNFRSTFSSYKSIKSVNLSDNVTNIGNGVFSGCAGLTKVDISDSVTSIGRMAFYNCTELTNINIPDSVQSIGDWAFSGCEKLKSITIPASVTNIIDKPFGYYFDHDSLKEEKVSDFTIYGYKNTAAERYANTNGFTFITLDGQATEPTQLPTEAPTIAPFDPTKTTDRDIFGDIDGDGVITIVDTTFLQRYTIDVATPYPIGKAIEK